MGFRLPTTLLWRILLAFWLIHGCVSAISAYSLYETQRDEYLNGVDQKLLTGAMMARRMVGTDFHDGLLTPDSLSEERYLALIEASNRVAEENGFQYVWSNLFLADGSVVFTTATSQSKDVTQGDHASFFSVHSDPDAFAAVMNSGTTEFSTFQNEWGHGRMVLVPYQDIHGRTYVFGASISINDLAARLLETTILSWVVFLVFLAIGTLGSVVIARAISRSAKRLNRVADQITNGDYGLEVPNCGGGQELEALGQSITKMSTAIAANHTQLTRTVEALLETQRALEDARAELEDRVVQRTQDLRKVTEAVEQSPIMVMITDLGGTIEYVNPGFLTKTGYQQSEVLGKTPRILQSGETPDIFYGEMWSTLKRDGIWSGEIRDRLKNGQLFWAALTISQVNDNDGTPTHYVAIHEDITERKAMEAETEFARQQAELASRAKSDLLANMSHELRTPLNAIIGYSEAILGGYFGEMENARHKDYLTDIHKSGVHLLALISDVLDVSAIEAGKVTLLEEIVDVGAEIADCLRMVETDADTHGVVLTVQQDPALPALRADSRRLKQMLLNLLSNAVKFTPDGGKVSLSAQFKTGEGMVFSVSDTGIGMTAEELEKAQETFGQVETGMARSFEGTGLGLPLTKSLVELHGGSLRIDSEKGVGTTVTLTFPETRCAGEGLLSEPAKMDRGVTN
ncbi:MAG: ATP-binding protein [Rhodospirillaceae bacterium]